MAELYKYLQLIILCMSQTSVFEFAQQLGPKQIHNTNNVIPISTSTRTAYRHLHTLKKLGFITKSARGSFIINNVAISQPTLIRNKLLSSLKALKLARRFGKHYNDFDIRFAKSHIPAKLTTLDYKAWELTKYQYPSDLYMYVGVEDLDKTVLYLKENGFSEGKRGHVIILPMIDDFPNKKTNEIERVYLDCIAKGGRSIQDAIAIELLHSDSLTFRANFPTEYILKVQEDLPNQPFN